MLVRTLLVAAALALAAGAHATSIGPSCVSCPPAAVTIDSAGDAFRLQFDGNVKGRPTPGLGATASFVVTAFDAATGHVALEITLANATDAALFRSARVTALGFDVDATLVAATSSGLFDHALRGSNFPNGFGALDVCAISSPSSCSGGGSPGVAIGRSGIFTLTLDFGGPLTSLTLSKFGVRYQSVGPVGPFVDDAGTGCGRPVPEPRVLALLGVAGLAALGRKRRTAA